jgi:hypothetical protein
MSSSTSNEPSLDGKRVVIKCAACGTDQVGVTLKMLERLDAIVGAFQLDGNSFEVWSLPADVFRTEMTPTRSRGPAAGRVWMVRRAIFTSRGAFVGHVRMNS